MYILVKDDKYVQMLSDSNFAFSDKVFQPASSLTDEQCKEFGVFELVETAPPGFDIASQTVSEGAPTLANGSWLQSWIVSDLTKEEIAERLSAEAKKVRAMRAGFLQASDWTALVDCPLGSEGAAAWRTYRQALRDITKQNGFPFNVKWPSEPN